MKYHIIAFAIAAVTLFSCGGDDTPNPNGGLTNQETINIVEKSAALEEGFDSNIDRYLASILATGRSPMIKFKDLSDCTTVQNNHQGNVYTITVTFDEGGCEDNAGNIHEGVINIVAEISGDSLIIDKTLSNYTFNDYAIAGDIHSVITDNDEDQRQIHREANLVITSPEGLVNTREANHIITLIEGGDDDIYSNNVYSINGSSSNVLSSGATWNVTILSSIIRPGSCHFYATQGQKSVTNSTQNSSYFIDYGDGECDGVVNITLPNGDVYQYQQF